jgi:phage shock protein A
MGIFTRFRDIVSSNINAMLDRAEDPEKLIKMMIREMEDTLVELKASCAAVIAGQKKIQRRLDEARSRESLWDERSRLAVEKGRDDLAREALVEKRRFSRMVEILENDRLQHVELIEQYRDDIGLLEEKLSKAKEKQNMLIQRHRHAQSARQAQDGIRRMDNFETIAKFEELESRIDRMEAEAELVNTAPRNSLDDAFDKLTGDEDIERELSALKASRKPAVEKTAGRTADLDGSA